MAGNTNVHKDHRGRIRTKFHLTGFDGWGEHEVLEMLLFYAIPRVNTNPIAHKLIDYFGSLSKVLDASVEELQNVEGIGYATAVYISSLGKLQGIYTKSKWINKKERLSSAAAMGFYCVDYIGNEQEEVFAVITLDSQYIVQNRAVIQRGLIDSVSVSTRKIAEMAFRTKSRYIVICHNHPSGLPNPSDVDINVTKSIISALSPLNIDLIDHIVVGGGHYISMAQQGFINN